MAKICKDIVCGEKYFFITEHNELVCQTENHTEILMPVCNDFDAVMADNGVHIAATDNQGNLVYIVNINGHWGKGTAEKAVMAENIFINCENGRIVIYYTADVELYKIFVEDDKASPILIDRVLCYASPFIWENTAYYINENKKLCADKEEICEGKNVAHIFATNEYLCVKDDDTIDLISKIDFSDKKSLTRRHGRSAECPLYVCTGDGETLCWKDEDAVFFARKKDDKWCALESFSVKNAERLGVFKFDGKYDLGCLKEGKICSFNMKK